MDEVYSYLIQGDEGAIIVIDGWTNQDAIDMGGETGRVYLVTGLNWHPHYYICTPDERHPANATMYQLG